MCLLKPCKKESGRNGEGFCNEHYLDWLSSPEYKRLGADLSWAYLLQEYITRRTKELEKFSNWFTQRYGNGLDWGSI